MGSLAVAPHTAVAAFHPDRPHQAALADRPLVLRIREVAAVADTPLVLRIREVAAVADTPLAVREDDRPRAFQELDKLQVRLADRHLVGSHPLHQEACPAGRAEAVLHRQRRQAGRLPAGMHQPVGRGEDIRLDQMFDRNTAGHHRAAFKQIKK